MSRAKVAVIIPTFNRKEVTVKCVDSLLNGLDLDINIIICDSDSVDGTRDVFVNYPNVTVINVGADSWWTGAINGGLKIIIEKEFEYILLLNDDIDIPMLLVESLLKKAHENPDRIISTAQVSSQGVFLGINYSGLLKLPVITWFDSNRDYVDVESSNGCCLLVPTNVFCKIGFFDDIHCPHLYGDTEFQVRANAHGFGTRAFSDIIIKQHPNTDYYRKLSINNILTFKGSPVNLQAYLYFGKSLFGGWFQFFFLGGYHHYLYLRSLLKAFLSCIAKWVF